jgi:Phage minor capsid protein 2
MLRADQFDSLVSPITDLYAEYETSVIEDIARRLKNMDFSSAAWATQRVTESGALYKNVLKELARLTGKSETQIAEILKRAGVKAMQFDDKIYKDAGLDPLPLNLSPAMAQVLKATLDKTSGIVNNLTMTTALTAQQSFIKAADLAHLQVSSGAMSYDQAIKAAVKNVAAQGLDVIDYATGHTDKLDVATRRAVLTGVSQTANQLQDTRADEMGVDLVQVSAHAGARNKGTGPENHASWQGKIYSRSGTHPKYPNFAQVTGYGTGPGLGGWNCRHSFFPFFEGISENAYEKAEVRSLNKQKVKADNRSVSLYDATQMQREIERRIRFWKRQAAALDAAKIPNQKELAKVSEWQAIMRKFISQTGLDRQSVREQVL